MSSPSAENPIDNESLERALTMEEWMRESSKEKRAIREFERRVITDECSFAKGYVLQPVFACATCTPPDSGVYAGFCLGCSIHCHRDHEILELFNKRNFRCDCGNGKFPDSSKCQLYGAKSDSNTKNKYNHNFKGKYCYCDSDYVEGQDTMAQCIHCEDWFHDRCLSESARQILSLHNDDVNMICKNCALKVSVLFNYSIGNHILDAEADKENKMSCKKPAGVISEKENGVFNSELFFPLDLESRLCRCTSCLEEYKKQELEYILNEEQIKENAWNIDAMDMEISDEEDDSNENAAEPSSDLFSDTGSHLTQEQKLLVASKLQDLMAAFKQGLKEEVLASSAVNKGEMDDIRKDIVVSGEDMARVIQKVGHIMKNRSSSKRKREDVDLN